MVDIQTCGAPGCPRPATLLVSGKDYDGTEFNEAVCESCAGYLLENEGTTYKPLPG